MESRFKWLKTVSLVALCLTLLTTFAPLGQAEELVNMEFKQAPLVDVFQILGQLGGYNVLVDPSVSGHVSFALKELGVEEALDLVTRTTGYRYQLVGNTLVIASAERLKSEFGSENFTFVVIQHVGVEAAQRLVSMVVPNLKSYTDPELSLLVLYGPTSDLETARTVIREYDQKAYVPGDMVASKTLDATVEVEGEEVARRLIPVYYAAGDEIVARLQQVWPQRDFAWDDRTQNVVGYTLLSEWAAVEAFVIERDLPNFEVKGILGSADQTMVLVEYRGATTLLKAGEELNGWKLSAVVGNVAEFVRGERAFKVGMGR